MKGKIVFWVVIAVFVLSGVVITGYAPSTVKMRRETVDRQQKRGPWCSVPWNGLTRQPSVYTSGVRE